MACRRARGLGCWRLDFLRGTVTTSLGGLQWLGQHPDGEAVSDGHTASIPDGVSGPAPGEESNPSVREQPSGERVWKAGSLVGEG